MKSYLCPKCKVGGLCFVTDYYECENVSCRSTFISFNNCPVLIDFTKSLIKNDDFLKSGGESVVMRRKFFFQNLLSSLINGDGLKTKRNINLCLSMLSKDKVRVLIVGGGTKGSGTELLYSNERIDLSALDIYYSPNITVIADAHDLPYHDKSFDLVIIQAVLEHVLDPNRVIEECYRVLSDGGLIYSETPFMQQVHEGPYDFLRFSHSGHRYLHRDFVELRSGFVGGLGTSLLWSISYLFRGLFRSHLLGKIARLMFFWLRFFDNFISVNFNLDGACGLFFVGQKSENYRFINSQIVTYYRGAQ